MKGVEGRGPPPVTVDRATREILQRAGEEGYDHVWERLERQRPQCGFGEAGLCCHLCDMGPCNIDPFGRGAEKGVCGAGASTMVARNLVRMVAGGSAAHSSHGRFVARTMANLGEEGELHHYSVEEGFLEEVCRLFGMDTGGLPLIERVRGVGRAALSEFGRQDGELLFTSLAPEGTRRGWRDAGITPGGIDREIVEVLHRTTMGVDADSRGMILAALRTALSDGWGGSMTSTILQDILLGPPEPIRSRVNLGVLKKDEVNIVVHGHEPLLAPSILRAAASKEMQELARGAGAGGINVAGMCCTGNELLVRKGVPVVGNFLQQELAIMTAAVESLFVDVQCIMPSLTEIASRFHTEIVSTSESATFPGVRQVRFEPSKAESLGMELVRSACENYRRRQKGRVVIPPYDMDVVAGFTAKNLFTILGGRYRHTYSPLNFGIRTGRIRGVAGIVGCVTPKLPHEKSHIEVVKELIGNDILVVQTGCSALACAKEGLLVPESAERWGGKGLREICDATGLPPVLHFGSCVDNSRILLAMCHMVEEGGIGEELRELPVAAAAPEWMTEKAIAIGCYFVASGIFTLFGRPFPIAGSREVFDFLTHGIEETTGGRFAFEEEPSKIVPLMVDHITGKRRSLGLAERYRG